MGGFWRAANFGVEGPFIKYKSISKCHLWTWRRDSQTVLITHWRSNGHVNRHTDYQAHRLRDTQTDLQTDTHTKRQTDKQGDQRETQTTRYTDRLTDTHTLKDRQTGRLINGHTDYTRHTDRH